jgi:hypothetical protein
MNKNDSVIVLYEKKHSRKAHWVFIAIILFLVIFMPIYGTTLRYDVSNTLRFIFSSIGELSLTFGGALTGLSVVFSIFSRKFYLKSFIFGIVLLWIGAFMTDTQFSLFGSIFGGNSPSKGYR